MKKLLAMLVALVMCFAVIPAAYAAEGELEEKNEELQKAAAEKDAQAEEQKADAIMPLILPDKASRRAWMQDEHAARALLANPPEVLCRVQADEPEQMDLFELIDMLEI